MQLVGGDLYFSPSDLNEFLECRNLTRLEHGIATEGGKRPPRDPFTEFVAKKGNDHEVRYLEALETNGGVERIPSIKDADTETCAELTLEAMRAGKDVIYQAYFIDGRWRGQADFLYRVDTPSALGDFSYEVGDTKLALHTRPYHLLQLCSYSDMLEKVQGVAPERMRVILGSQDVRRFRVADYSAYFRHVKARFLAEIENAKPTFPTPCAHCDVCRWKPACEAKREEKDHLSLVANMRRSQIERLAPKITTLEALGRSSATDRPGMMAESTFETLRRQAALQLHHRETGAHKREFLPLKTEERRGFALLPPPDAGDVFFDMEGDPLYWEGHLERPTGLEYLFGWVTIETGSPRYDRFLARDRSTEKVALEQFIDFIMARWREYPAMHVYHYAHYEKSTLEKLAAFHATREDEVDELLRAGVLVDLYQIVRHSMQISQPSYSIKKMEAFYRPSARSGEVQGGAESVLAFETWLDAGAVGEPKDVIAYNEDDCESTYELCSWLRAQREEAGGSVGAASVELAATKETPLNEATIARRARIAALSEKLKTGYPEDESTASTEQRARKLLADLLEYHRREDRPAYWKFFERRDRASEEELLENAEAIVGLERDPANPPYPDAQSTVYTFSFPVQETKLNEKSDVIDPNTDASPGNVITLDPRRRILVLKRGKKIEKRPLPKTIILGRPRGKNDLTDALAEFAEDVLASESGSDHYPGLWDVLTRTPPRRRGVASGPLVAADAVTADIEAVAAALDQSYLFVQGPPGTGKTYTGAEMIVKLLAEKKRVGVAANSHKAVHNLLEEVERRARARGVTFRGFKKCNQDDEDSRFNSDGSIESIAKCTLPAPGELIACTVHSFPNLGFRGTLDYLFVDEAGQVALADALAIGTAAKNTVFLGDPLQLAQVSQGTHPEGAGASVLEHLLGDNRRIPAERGVFLNKSRRMHPDVCRFISTVVYDGGLDSIPECSQRSISVAGKSLTGLSKLVVEHAGWSQRCEPEALKVLEVVRVLSSGHFVTGSRSRPMSDSDILVVAPYNAQVREIRSVLDDAGFESVRVGTVDKFQGQEAPAVLYSLTTSSRDDLPRDIDFLFSRNRLNVAVSRAQCLAVLLFSPQLLEIGCSNVEQMHLVNALCLFNEEAAPFGSFPTAEPPALAG